nr:MAG TPA: hypothetical protein [Caudoviricetes sp.]
MKKQKIPTSIMPVGIVCFAPVSDGYIFQRGVSRATSGACCRTCSSRAVSLR